MARYIDEDILYKSIEEKYKNAKGDARKAYSKILDILCETPTADVVEVVRCKDCKYFSEIHHCGVLGFCEPNEYCSRGRRRKENGAT